MGFVFAGRGSLYAMILWMVCIGGGCGQRFYVVCIICFYDRITLGVCVLRRHGRQVGMMVRWF